MSTTRLSSGFDTSVHFSRQTSLGSVNATPEFTEFRRTEGKALTQKGFQQSSEIKVNRQARGHVISDVTYSANLSFEATEQTIGYLIESTQATEVADNDVITTLQATATGFVDSADAVFANVSVDDYIFLSGFTSSSIDRTYRVTVKNSDGDIETEPAPATTESAGQSITYVMNKSVSGTNPSYYTIQTRTTDNSKAGAIDYQTFYDCHFNSTSLEIGETGIITGNFGINAESLTSGTAQVSGQTDAAADTSNVLSSVDNVARIWLDGVDSNCTIKSMGFNFSNNLKEDRMASVEGAAYANGHITLTGSLAARLPVSSSQVWRSRYEAGTIIALAAEINHTATKTTIIEVPQAVITDYSVADGNNVIANAQMTYGAEEDSTHGVTSRIFRNWGGAAGALPYNEQVIDSSPTERWKLGEATGTTATGEMGYTDLTYSGSPTLAQTKIIPNFTGTSVIFDGTNDLAARFTSLLQFRGDLTMIFTFRVLAHNTTIVSCEGANFGGGTYNKLYMLALDASGYLVYSDHKGSRQIGTTVFNVGATYHFAFVRDTVAGQYRLTVNGVLDSSATWLGAVSSGSNAQFKLAGTTRSPSYSNIHLQDFNIYDRQVSQYKIGLIGTASGV